MIEKDDVMKDVNQMLVILMLVLALVFAAAAFAGCDAPPGRVKAGLDGSIQTVQLEDGTRCAFMRSNYGGGLSCDWEATRLDQGSK